MAHPRPPGSDPAELVVERRSGLGGEIEFGLGVDTDLEPVDPPEEHLTEASIGVEHVDVVSGPLDPCEYVDLAGRIEDERPPCRADLEVADLLGDLGLQVRLGVGTRHRDPVTCPLVDEEFGCGHGVVGVHACSLAWHTANAMTDDDDNSEGHDDGADNAIRPDSVTEGASESALDGNRDVRSPLDQLAQRAVDVVLDLLRRANALAGGVLMFAIVSCVVGYLLGIAALDGGARIFWIIVGGLGAAWAIGSVLIGMWRLRMVRQGSDAMVDEVRTLIRGDRKSERTVVETVESTEGENRAGVVHLSRQFFSLRNMVGDHTSNFTQLTLALTSITTFPGLMALATLIGVAFGGLSLIFLLILIF